MEWDLCERSRGVTDKHCWMRMGCDYQAVAFMSLAVDVCFNQHHMYCREKTQRMKRTHGNNRNPYLMFDDCI